MKKMLNAAAFGISLILATGFAFAAEQKADPAKPAAAVAEKKVASVDPTVRKGTSKSAAEDRRLDLNTATEAELKAIGIGNTDAKKIIAGRPYTKKTQLKSKKILPEDLYAQIKDNIVAKKAKK